MSRQGEVKCRAFKLVLGAFCGALCLALASGCATARPERSHRKGLFDRWSSDDSGNSGSPWRKKGTGPLPGDDAEQARALARMPAEAHALRWPLDYVRVTSPFGKRAHEFHEGLDLAARTGTPVHAAQSGLVLYSGKRIRGYGKLIVIRHSGGFSTIYAHNSRLVVRAGQRVRRGQVIAYSGATGHVTGPHLHFEVRQGVVAVDPLKLLPRNLASGSRPSELSHPNRVPAARLADADE